MKLNLRGTGTLIVAVLLGLFLVIPMTIGVVLCSLMERLAGRK